MSACIWLLRHGATEWSEQELHTGRADPPLSAEGRRQARGAARLLAGRSFEQVLVSPQIRAIETCEIAGFGTQAQVCDQLVEWDYGEYEGMTDDDTDERRPGWSLFRDGAPRGESPQQVKRRIEQVLALLGGASGPCLLVGHGKVLRALGALWLGQEIAFAARLPMEPAAIGVLEHEEGEPLLRTWNLRPELATPLT